MFLLQRKILLQNGSKETHFADGNDGFRTKRVLSLNLETLFPLPLIECRINISLVHPMEVHRSVALHFPSHWGLSNSSGTSWTVTISKESFVWKLLLPLSSTSPLALCRNNHDIRCTRFMTPSLNLSLHLNTSPEWTGGHHHVKTYSSNGHCISPYGSHLVIAAAFHDDPSVSWRRVLL